MKHIIEKWEQNIYESAFWEFYFGNLKVGVLDIETTGLNPGRNKFILGGLYDVRKGEIHQVLAENRAEEPIALAEYLRLITDVDLVVTYNGRHFDMPFIEKRRQVSASAVNYLNAEMGFARSHQDAPDANLPPGANGVKIESDASGANLSPGATDIEFRNNMMTEWPLPYNLDLYLVLSGHSPIRKLVPNMKQKTVEEYMGFWDTRADDISGAESVQLYNHYEATQDPVAEEKILLHNNDDVRQLTRLTKAIIKSDFHKAMYKLGFPIKYDDHMLIINKIQVGKDSLCISGVQNKSPINYMGFEFNGQPVTSTFDAHAIGSGRAMRSANSVREGDGSAMRSASSGREGDGRAMRSSSGVNDTVAASGTFEIKVPIVCQQGYKVVDLETFGLEETEANSVEAACATGFEDYPGYGSGFLIIEDHGEIRYRELNHFAKAFIGKVIEEIS